ncbi:MAG TPA: PQQ-binding-like beta-propeller repeat protein [Pyrinomonadaceae bacterium]|nr:PQQ-binding-like beta-propeller repeat protein [Pyrinomonadaceae bacterium]
MKRFLIALALTLGTALATFNALSDWAGVLATAPDANWPQWRGPGSTGVSAEKNLPVEWSATKNLKWKAAVPGRGHSSPIVWGNKVFLTTAIEGEAVPGAKAPTHMSEGEVFKHPDSVGADRKHTFKVLAYDKETGKLLWEQTAYTGTPYDDRHRKSSFASSTPSTDGRHVYAYFGSEGLFAYDMNGKLAWKADLGNFGTVGMGTGTSPVLYENLVILQCDEEEGKASFIVALDKKSGKEVWRTARKVQVSWATPILVRAGKRTELIASGTEFIISYDPATGKELWRTKGVESNAIPTPVAADETVFVVAGYPAKIAMAIRLGGAGEIPATNILWKYAKGTAYVPSPILYDGYLYLTTDRGILTALDAKTGKVVYEGGRVPIPATFTASPVAFDGKILLTSEDGDTFIVKAGPQHEVLRTNSLDEPVYASPALADGKIFIRGEKNLYCIGKS